MSREPSPELDALASRVIGAAIKVHRALGPGHLESAYEKALCIELTKMGIRCVTQYPFTVYYENEPVAESRADMLVEDQLLLELKAVEKFARSIPPKLSLTLKA